MFGFGGSLQNIGGIMSLSDLIKKKKGETSNIASNEILNSIDEKLIIHLEKNDNFVIDALYGTLSKRLDELPIDISGKNLDSWINFINDLHEFEIRYVLNEKGIPAKKISEGRDSSPDFDIGSNGYLEMKTIHFDETMLKYQAYQSEALEANIDLEQQQKDGKKIASTIRVVQPYTPKAGMKYDSYSKMIPIRSILDKIKSNYKPAQFNLGDTALLVDMRVIGTLGQKEKYSVYPTFETENCLNSGVLWNVCFVKEGMTIYKSIEFEGRPNIEGQADFNGMICDDQTNSNIKAIVFIFKNHTDVLPKFYMLYRSENEELPLIQKLVPICSKFNDNLNSRFFEKTID